MSTPFIAALAQFPVGELRSWPEFEQLLSRWVGDAAAHGAKLLVFPEYGAMTLSALFEPAVRADLQAQLVALQDLREAYLELHRRLAREHGVYLLAGSFPWQLDDGRYVNRAWFCGPGGHAEFQDKIVMTRFEREVWGISGAPPLKVFDTTLGRIGINICYDVEFPLLARAQAQAGAALILAPSCTDTMGGYWRVRVGAQARALENQCVVMQAPLVGIAPWSPAVDVNCGAAGVFGPPDYGFPDDGVIALGRMSEPQWLFADIDLSRVEQVRAAGQVFNFRHWGDQPGAGAVDTVQVLQLD